MDNAATATEARPSPYDMLGGAAGLRRLVDRFYDIMDTDPAAAGIRAMHAPDLAPMRKMLFEFFSGWLGGPRLYSNCVMSAHNRFAIGESERDQWLHCMRRAAEDTGMPAELREPFDRILARMADGMRSR